MTYSIVDRTTGEEIGPFRYTRFDDAEEHAADLRATSVMKKGGNIGTETRGSVTGSDSDELVWAVTVYA